jgi:hypothetical protein
VVIVLERGIDRPPIDLGLDGCRLQHQHLDLRAAHSFDPFPGELTLLRSNALAKRRAREYRPRFVGFRPVRRVLPELATCRDRKKALIRPIVAPDFLPPAMIGTGRRVARGRRLAAL